MDWDEYLSYGLDDLDETDLDKYFQSDKDRWGYSGVYFLNEQSDYVTLDRKYGHLDCGSADQASAARETECCNGYGAER